MNETNFPKMNKRIKAKWLKALRGEAKEGKYLQYSEGGLHIVDDKGNDRFCCLGVLANICNLEGGLDGQEAFCGGYGELAFEWAGIHWDAAYKVAHMNDSGKGFTTIANWIEENL